MKTLVCMYACVTRLPPPLLGVCCGLIFVSAFRI